MPSIGLDMNGRVVWPDSDHTPIEQCICTPCPHTPHSIWVPPTTPNLADAHFDNLLDFVVSVGQAYELLLLLTCVACCVGLRCWLQTCKWDNLLIDCPIRKRRRKGNTSVNCVVCLEERRNGTALVPCGHVLCSGCAEHQSLKRCPICKRPRIFAQHLFLP